MSPTRRELAQVLEAVGRENVYRSRGAHICLWQVRAGQNKRVDRAVRQLVADGLVSEPPEGASFFTLTDDGAAALRDRRSS